MAYDYPGSCAPSRWLPSAPKQKLERGPFGLAHRVPRASPMRAASGCLPPAVRIIPQYVPGLQPRFGACCQSRAIYYQQKRGFPRHEKTRKRLAADSLTQPAGTVRGRASAQTPPRSPRLRVRQQQSPQTISIVAVMGNGEWGTGKRTAFNLLTL